MRSRMRRARGVRDIAIFWSLVIVSAAVLAILAFLAGKYWVGGLLARTESKQTAPKIVVKTPEELREEEEAQQMAEPPAKAVVKVEERAPSEGERSELEQLYPQDGADLSKSGESRGSDTSTGASDRELDEEASGGKRYVVSAGSFGTAANADKELADLLDRGYSPFIVKVTKDGKVYHRVSIGPYATREEAERVRDELVASGKPATVATR